MIQRLTGGAWQTTRSPPRRLCYAMRTNLAPPLHSALPPRPPSPATAGFLYLSHGRTRLSKQTNAATSADPSPRLIVLVYFQRPLVVFLLLFFLFMMPLPPFLLFTENLRYLFIPLLREWLSASIYSSLEATFGMLPFQFDST